jgi:hypothetical protein
VREVERPLYPANTPISPKLAAVLGVDYNGAESEALVKFCGRRIRLRETRDDAMDVCTRNHLLDTLATSH